MYLVFKYDKSIYAQLCICCSTNATVEYKNKYKMTRNLYRNNQI